MPYTFQGADRVIPLAIGDKTTSVPTGLALGTIVEAQDEVYGGGEFIFLRGVASTVLGSCVVYDGATAGVPTYQTALAPNSAGVGQAVAFATAAIGASEFGWYQISGTAIAATNGTMTSGSAVFTTGATGVVTSTAGNGRQVLGARSSSATGTPAANQCLLNINRPHLQSQIL